MLKKLLALTTALISTNSFAQQAIIFNKSESYDQSFHYQILYDNDQGNYSVIDDETINIPSKGYVIVTFPQSPMPESTMINVLSATQKNGASGQYDECMSGLSQTNVAIILDDQNGSPLITCDALDYNNTIK